MLITQFNYNPKLKDNQSIITEEDENMKICTSKEAGTTIVAIFAPKIAFNNHQNRCQLIFC